MKQINILMKKSLLHFFAVVTFCTLCTSSAMSQALDSKGTDFWLTFPGNYFGTVELSLFVSSEVNTSGTVSIPGLGFSVPFTVTAGNITTVVVPQTAQLDQSDVIQNNGIHVTALNEVTIYGLNRQPFTTDAFLGLPTDILGTSYINLGYTSNGLLSEFGIVATQNATTVTITPTETTNGHADGVPYNITLNQGQTYLLGTSSGDLSGSIISSNKPIAVFGGHQCANIPIGAFACDHIVEQLPPTTAWGRNFVSVPLKTRIGGDTFRFLASENGTNVIVNGATVATLNRGQFHEMILTTSSQITANKPILVSQYSNGSSFDGVTSDPFMMLITPYEQFLGNYTFSTPASGFLSNFVNVVAPAGAIGALQLDGAVIPAAAFSPIGSSGFSGAQLDLDLGVHTINGTNLPFGIFVYGFDSYDSYGYPGGQSLAPIATVSSLTLTPETGTASVGTSQCFSALVKDQFNNPVVGVRVDFNITGANPGSTGFLNTNGSGIAQFCYTGANAGTDNIVASVGTINDASSFIWTPIVIANDYYSKAAGDLHNVLSWGVNLDGSGANPPDFTAGKTFHLVNRVPLYTLTANWTVGGRLDIPAGSRLAINGLTLSIADLIGTGTLVGSLSSNLAVTTGTVDNITLNFETGGGNLNNLSLNRTGVSPSAIVASALNIYGVLTVTNGLLNTGNFITLKSNAANTARVAPVTGSISGNATVERYIPARRAWRIICAPVGGAQTINQAWQEGATTSSAVPNPNPGFGTHITEGLADGFDHNPLTAMASIKKYISATDKWLALTNTNVNTVNSDAFFLFVRGDRGVSLGYNNVPPNNTVLRATGTLKTGDQSFPVNAVGFTAIPNPFASPIDFATLTKTNVQNNFYLWDPKLGGGTGAGAYVLFSFNGSGYDVSPAPVSPESQYIQSGQGFMVRSTGSAGSLLIKESDKSATAATNVFRSANSTTKGLRATLQVVNKDKTTGILDESFTTYGPYFSNKVDNMDPVKLENINENLGISRDGQTLMMERRQEIAGYDTIHLQLWNTVQREYILQLSPVNLSASTIISGYLEDTYLHTNTPINTSELTTVKFSIDENPASASRDRFKVVLLFGKNILPAGYTNGTFKISPNPITGKVVNIQFID
ncbi:MAG: Ig-like domain-containing protein, partial [Rhizobacter sp.]|nr:Ig-like domain-containing protein [Ferruginibacter sp.]